MQQLDMVRQAKFDSNLLNERSSYRYEIGSRLESHAVAASPVEVRVKAVERNVETLDFSNAEAAKFSNKRPMRAAPEFGILLPETA